MRNTCQSLLNYSLFIQAVNRLITGFPKDFQNFCKLHL
jgi:hypothetical protein